MALGIRRIILFTFYMLALFARVNRGFFLCVCVCSKSQSISTLLSTHVDIAFVKSDFEELGRIDLYLGMIINLLC